MKICAELNVQTDPKVQQEYIQKELEKVSDMMETLKLQVLQLQAHACIVKGYSGQVAT